MPTMIAGIKLYLFLLVGFICFLLAGSCDSQVGEDTDTKDKSKEVHSIADNPLTDFQSELLDLAFTTASSIPVDPHIKDRSKAQEAVVMVCLELDQPKRALGYIEKIDNWRKGLGYANLAFYCAKHNYINEARSYLDIAERAAEEENERQWRKDRIRVKIAQTYIMLKQTEKTDKFDKELAESEKGKVEIVTAAVSNEDSFDSQITALDSLVSSGSFEAIKNALFAYAQLFDRFYEDVERRSLIEEKINKYVVELPLFIRLELQMTLADFSLGHDDHNKAMEIVNETQLLLDNGNWAPEDKIWRMAKLVKLRFKCGDIAKAHIDADASVALFDDQKERIVNIYRANALRGLAEAYKVIGDIETALSIYKQAVEEGVVNPNSRPRAEDISATCCSMALYAIEPDAQLWARMKQIYEGLGPPW